MKTSHADYGAMALRLSLGVMYLAHAGLKVFTFGIENTAAFFASQGLPGWAVLPVILAEIAAGVLLILGVRVRAVVIGMLPVLFGALLVHLGNGWVFTAPNGGWEYVAFLMAASVAQALLGSGAHAAEDGFRNKRTVA